MLVIYLVQMTELKPAIFKARSWVESYLDSNPEDSLSQRSPSSKMLNYM